MSPWCTGAASGHFHSARAPHYLLSLIPPLLPAAQRGHKDIIYLGVQLNPTHDGLQPAQGAGIILEGKADNKALTVSLVWPLRFEAACLRKLPIISKSPHFSYSKICSSDGCLARDHLGVFSGVILHACREKSNSTEQFPGQGAPWLPHVSLCLCSSPSGPWCCLWVLWGQRGEGKVPSQAQTPSHPLQ